MGTNTRFTEFCEYFGKRNYAGGVVNAKKMIGIVPLWATENCFKERP